MRVEIDTANIDTDPSLYLENARPEDVELGTYSGDTVTVTRWFGEIDSLESFVRNCGHEVVVGLSDFDGAEFAVIVYDGYLE